MKEFSRKDFLKSAAVVSAGAVAVGSGIAVPMHLNAMGAAEDVSGLSNVSIYPGESNMKITKLEPVLVDRRWLFVKVHTDSGLVGWGECGAWAWQEASLEALKALEKMIVGYDPFKIEWLWNAMMRGGHFRGIIINSAISGIDIALWDLKGKALGVPIYELLGGKSRDKIRAYVTARGNTPDEIASSVKGFVDEGWKHVRIRLLHTGGRGNPCPDNVTEKVMNNVEVFRQVREKVGYGIDISIEAHRGLKPVEAIELGKRVDKYLVHFYEDPVLDSPSIQRYVADSCVIPIATGERNINVDEHYELITTTNARYLRPDMCVIGGITAGKKVASIAEAKGVYIIPHNPLGPISTMAALQIDANIPNFEVQEWPSSKMNDYLKEPAFEVKNGYVTMSDKPGLGLEMLDDVGEKFPFTGASPSINLHEDGSIVDR